MGTIFVDNLEPQSGTSLTLGASGDTVGLASGASQTFAVNTPAFHAYRSDSQSVSDSTWTKMQVNVELYDSDGMYDNSTNYRFTPTTAGKYFIYGSTRSTVSLVAHYTAIRKNGSEVVVSHGDGSVASTFNCQSTIDFNGSSDYVELWVYYQGASNSNQGLSATFFGGYKVIGA
jgi:hypothetical protein